MTEMIVFMATLPFNAIRMSLIVARDRSLKIGREMRRRCAPHHRQKGPELLRSIVLAPTHRHQDRPFDQSARA